MCDRRSNIFVHSSDAVMSSQILFFVRVKENLFLRGLKCDESLALIITLAAMVSRFMTDHSTSGSGERLALR